jgi:hypothetical protein
MIDLENHFGFGDPPVAIRLLLFAPAHKGSILPLMLASDFGIGWLPVAGAAAIARIVSPALNDLSRGSETLIRLEADSRTLREKIERQNEELSRSRGRRSSSKPEEAIKPSQAQGLRPATTHLLATVLHAAGDKVVVQEPFDADPPMQPVMRQNHRSICKPRRTDYTTPTMSLSGFCDGCFYRSRHSSYCEGLRA